MVASIYPLADIVRQVGGDAVEVTTLLAPGRDPHGYELKPAQADALAQAHLLVNVGAGLDDWATRAPLAKDAARLTLADVVKFSGEACKHEGCDHGHGEHDEGAHDAHAQGQAAGDPHIWLDPVAMQNFVAPLAAELARIDPAHADDYRRRGDQLLAELMKLDADYRAALSAVPRKHFVTFHPSFTHIAQRYGLEQMSLRGASSGGFGPRQIEAVADFMREHDVRTIFVEPQFPVGDLETLAKRTGAKIGRLDPLGNPAVAGYDGYLPMMRSNLQALAQGLSGQ